jgi:hypothetical protein
LILHHRTRARQSSLSLLYILILFTLCAPLALSATAPAKKVVVRLAPPIALGDPLKTTYLRAASAFRWVKDQTTFIDLRGDARLFQGETFIRAPRLLVRMRTRVERGVAIARISVFASAGASYQAEAGHKQTTRKPTVFRITARAGIILSEPLVIGDPPGQDTFTERAHAAFDAKAGAVLPAGIPEGFIGEMRPSAEEFIIANDKDKGAAITLRGNAEIAGEGFYLAADTIRIRFHPTGEERPSESSRPSVHTIYAEGAVDLHRGTQRITANAIFLNVTDEEALALEARIRISAPSDNLPVTVQFYADTLRQISLHRFRCESPGWFSTSKYARPAVRVQSNHIDIIRGPGAHKLREAAKQNNKPSNPGADSVVVMGRNNWVTVGSIPVLYWPYLANDVTTGTFLLKGGEVGDSSNMGTTIKAEWDLYDLGILNNDWSELSLFTDYYSERGFGIGSLFDYKTSDRHGFIKGYYINDTASEDDRNLPKPETSRGQLTWRHRERNLPLGFEGDIEYGLLSDMNYLRIYDRDEYDDAKDHETTIFLQRPDENHLFTAQSKIRINDHENTVERQALGYHIIGQPDTWFGSDAYWTSHNEAALLRLRPRSGTPAAKSDVVGRVNSDNELSYPINTGPIRWVPYARGGLTLFSEEATDSSATLRTNTGFGLRASTNIYRTFMAQCESLDIDGVRHILTPTFDYENLFHVSGRPSDFIQHDTVDALDDQHRIRFGLHNRLQTHRWQNGRREVVDFLTFDLDFVHQINNPSWMGNEDTLLEGNFEWRISEYVTLSSTDDRLNLDNGDIERLNGTIAVNLFKPLSVTLTQEHYLDTAVAGKPDHNVTRVGFSYQPEFSRWRVDMSVGHDWTVDKQAGDTRDPADLDGTLAIHRQFDDWAMVFELEINTGRRGDNAFTVRLVPPGSQNSQNYSFR